MDTPDLIFSHKKSQLMWYRHANPGFSVRRDNEPTLPPFAKFKSVYIASYPVDVIECAETLRIKSIL
jgi:hypothetical protein